jgi:uncharacterized protein DUF4337
VEPKEAAEVIREVGHNQSPPAPEAVQLHRTIALLVGVLSMLLAIATISTGASTRKLLNTNIKLTDLRSDTDAKEVGRYTSLLGRDVLQTALDTTNPSSTTRAAIQKLIDGYAMNADTLERGVTSDDGLKAREEQIDDLQGAEVGIENHILTFEYSEVALQIGIVLASLAILLTSRRIFLTSCALGVLGALLLVNGFTSGIPLPSLH